MIRLKSIKKTKKNNQAFQNKMKEKCPPPPPPPPTHKTQTTTATFLRPGDDSPEGARTRRGGNPFHSIPFHSVAYLQRGQEVLIENNNYVHSIYSVYIRLQSREGWLQPLTQMRTRFTFIIFFFSSQRFPSVIADHKSGAPSMCRTVGDCLMPVKVARPSWFVLFGPLFAPSCQICKTRILYPQVRRRWRATANY